MAKTATKKESVESVEVLSLDDLLTQALELAPTQTIKVHIARAKAELLFLKKTD